MCMNLMVYNLITHAFNIAIILCNYFINFVKFILIQINIEQLNSNNWYKLIGLKNGDFEINHLTLNSMNLYYYYYAMVFNSIHLYSMAMKQSTPCRIK